MPEPTPLRPHPTRAPARYGGGPPRQPPGPPFGDGDGRPRRPDTGPRSRPLGRPKLKKLRLALILAGLGALALISTVFGMMMAVASELPALENQTEFRNAENSTLLAGGDEIASLTGNQHRILIDESEVSPTLKNAVIAIEDRRFYEHEGVDYLGIARAFVQDVAVRSAAQGGSTITQQFVKNALAAQNDRTVFQKLRESALAYHLERQWSKQKILTQYLNSVYFGNGAYGVESAMRTYFGEGRKPDDYGSNERLATTAEPHEAALLAAMISSPIAYDPVQNPEAALDRRNLVLDHMLEQGLITDAEYDDSVDEPVPTEDDITPPEIDSSVPFFTTWVTQQLVDRYGAGTVFGGGLEVSTTLDPALQQSAEQAVEGNLAGVGPSAAVVTVENRTGEVKAMVGGEDFDETAFNLATNGHRQPGSAIKPFTLVTALEQGVSASDIFTSEKKVLTNPENPAEKFTAENYEETYTGPTTLVDATINSDNSIYAELGLQAGTENIARTASAMGIETPLSTNPAMTLGGLEQGLTPLEMAFAYTTLANDGVRRSGQLASSPMGPVGIEKVQEGDETVADNEPSTERVFPEAIGTEAKEMLTGVVTSGTGKSANIPGAGVWGKTGTTENYGDGWFVGGTEKCTTAVWVGYPDRIRPMKTEYRGQPVAGGTFPADIWHDYMVQALELDGDCAAAEGAIAPTTPVPGSETTTTPTTPSAPAPPAEPTTPAPTTPTTPQPQTTTPTAPAAPQTTPQTAPQTTPANPSAQSGAPTTSP
jgi:penicillin-binding protein 1A